MQSHDHLKTNLQIAIKIIYSRPSNADADSSVQCWSSVARSTILFILNAGRVHETLVTYKIYKKWLYISISDGRKISR